MKKTVSFLLLITLCFSLVSNIGFGYFVNDSMYTISEPYNYPIMPGSDEWAALQTNIDKINACSIPDNIASNMTTDALLESFLNHPLAINIFTFDSYDAGFNVLKEYYHMGINELMSREDLSGAILNRYNNISVCENSVQALPQEMILNVYETEISDMWEMSLLEVLAAQLELNSANPQDILLLSAIEDKYHEKSNNINLYGKLAGTYYRVLEESNTAVPLNNDTYVYTPLGTPVSATYITDEYSQATQASMAAYMAAIYPNATLLRPATPKYNCHSYAWHSTSSSNSYMVWDPLAYMNDGSYNKISTAQVGAKIYYSPVQSGYPDPSLKRSNHSGIVSSINPVYVTSKWADYGLYNHYYSDCPYYYKKATNYISFWIIN